jgi:hypothetical protein
MNKSLLLFFAVLLSNVQSASAIPLSSPSPIGPNTLLLWTGAADCTGPIATEAHPISGAGILAKMRREGRLPDSFVCGRCRYDLGGDPGVAYYVKTCK